MSTDFIPSEWSEDERKMRRDAKKAFISNVRCMLEQYAPEAEPWQAAIRLMRWRHLELSIINTKIERPDQPSYIITVPSVDLNIHVGRKFEIPQEVHHIPYPLTQRDIAIAINELSTTHRQIMADIFSREARKYWKSVTDLDDGSLPDNDSDGVYTQPSLEQMNAMHDAIWYGKVPLRPEQRAA